jgi:phosphohistidine phosphatase SixA
VVDAASALNGAALVEALRAGGYVLYMRHATLQNPHPDCPDSPGLDASGLAQTRSAGAAIRALGIAIDSVWTSRTCRTEFTARALGLGPVQVTDDLNPLGLPEGANHEQARLRRLNSAPPAGRNTVLVSHWHGSHRIESRLQLGMGDMLVFKPRSDGWAVAVARIGPNDWAGLTALRR